MSGWCWLAPVDGDVAGADAVADVRDAARRAGWPPCGRRRAKPVRQALRADERVLDAEGGPPSSRSSCRRRAAVLFDDPAVQQARRDVLAGSPARRRLDLLMRDARTSSARSPPARRRRRPPADDPFARIFPRPDLLDVGPGLLGRIAPPPAGPTIERYGTASPWPWDRYG